MSQHDPHNTPPDDENIAAGKRPQPDVEDVEPAGTAVPDDAEAANTGSGDDLEVRLEQALAEAENYRDQALRAQAEMENVRKRAQRDVEAAHKFALEKFARELLGVCDSLDYGLASAEADHGDFDKLKEGMEMTRRQLVSTLEKAGVEVINPVGETFNPDYHEAVSTQPSDELKPNTVAAVMQKGYSLNGRVLRAAMVTVAKPAG